MNGVVSVPKDPGGKTIGFKTVEEEWHVYELEDGHTVKIKEVLVGIKDTGDRRSDGTPRYTWKTQTLFEVLESEGER